MNQLLAAGLDPPALACMSVGCAGSDFHEGWTYRGGALQLAFILSWTIQALAGPDAVRRQDRNGPADPRLGPQCAASAQRPLTAWLKSGELPPFFSDWIDHEARDDYWASLIPSSLYRDIAVPCLHVTGWYDIFVEGGLRNFQRLSLESAAAGTQHLVVGPWQHVPWMRSMASSTMARQRRTRSMICSSLVQPLAESAAMIEAWPKVRYFLMGADCWQSGELAAAIRKLHPLSPLVRMAGSLQSDGRLLLDPPVNSPPIVCL